LSAFFVRKKPKKEESIGKGRFS